MKIANDARIFELIDLIENDDDSRAVVLLESIDEFVMGGRLPVDVDRRADVAENLVQRPEAAVVPPAIHVGGLDLLADVGGVLYDGAEATVYVGTATDVDADGAVDFDAMTDLDAVVDQLTPGEETQCLFFTGKGGVGKSTVASTAATTLAEAGHETFVVTTDPAAHLEDIFGKPVGHEPTSVRQENLDAARIDQKKARKNVASAPDDDPLMSVVIDAALAHLVESEENIRDAREEHNPVILQELCNTSVIGLQYPTRIKAGGGRLIS